MNRTNQLPILARWQIAIRIIIFFTFLASNSFGQQKDSIFQSPAIPSAIFGKIRKISITLPAEYYSQPNKKFPVVYLFDAQSKALLAFTQATMGYLYGTNSLDPMILVGIQSERRQFEFTPQNQTSNPFAYNPNAKFSKNIKVGGADTLLLHLETEVFPYIEKHYRTLPVRLGVGHSLGATFVTYCLTQNKAIFNAIIAVSPNYAYDQEQMVARVKQYIHTKNIPPAFFYLARGEQSELLFNPGIEKVVSVLNTKKPSAINLKYAVLDVVNHGNTALEGFTKGFIAYHNSIYATADNIIHYFTRLSDIASYKLDAGQINQIAYDNFMMADKYPQAVKIFAWGSRLYPNDYNLYDSRSEAEENSGNKKNALHYSRESLAKLEAQKASMLQKDYEAARKYISEKITRLQK